jgi:hypothetical protein
MLSEKRERVLEFDGKPIELMTPEERDAEFLEFSGMTYDEFWDYYKDDTPESLEREFREFVKRCAIK